MIKSNYSVKILKIIFDKIASILQKNLYSTRNSIGLKLLNGQLSQEGEDKKTSHDLTEPQDFSLLWKKTIIKQPEIYYHLFLPLEFKNINPEYILKLLILFVNSLLFHGVPVQQSFQTILISLLRKINNFSLISIFLQYHSLPDSIELAKFLIEECPSSDLNAFQMGLDILIRLKKYEEVFMALVNKNMIKEALHFVKRYGVSIDYISSETALNLKKKIMENEQLVIDFICSNNY
jgi:hypothetical protein